MINVLKFGSGNLRISNPEEALIKLAGDLKTRQFGEKAVLVLSAFPEMTNLLERMAEAYIKNDQDEYKTHLTYFRSYHHDIIRGLFPPSSAMKMMNDFNDLLKRSIDWYSIPVTFLNFKGVGKKICTDYILSFGEQTATRILGEYFDQVGLGYRYLSAVNVVKTDGKSGRAKILETQTEKMVQQEIIPNLKESGLVLTEGFIGGHYGAEFHKLQYITTLGREGSDLTAATLAKLLKNHVGSEEEVRFVCLKTPFGDTEPLSGQMNYDEGSLYCSGIVDPRAIEVLKNTGITTEIVNPIYLSDGPKIVLSPSRVMV